MKKQIMAVLLAVCVFAASVIYPAESAGAEENTADEFVGLDAQYHTQDELREYYKSHPVSDLEAQYVIPPSVTQPYALGELTEETKQDALNMLNIYRYIAGVPTVSITEEAQNYAQAAALLNAINKSPSHTQMRPEGISDELYSQGAYGSFNSNLAVLGNRLCATIQNYMLEQRGDPDFGHRRQLLDYYYEGAGFGMAQSVSGGYYSSVFVDANLKEDKMIAYPAQNQPLEYFGTGYAWTVIIPERVNKSEVHVKLTDTKTGNTWNFEQETGNLRLAVRANSTCAIFCPSEIEYREGDRYHVEITGIEKPISYEVNMFLLGDPVPLESIHMSILEYFPNEGNNDYTCKVEYTPKNATNRIVTWTSSDPEVARPVWNGTGRCRVIAQKTGTAVFTATSEDGGYTAEITIHVRPNANAVVFDKTDVTIGAGQTFELTGSTLPEEAGDMVQYMYDFDENIISVENTRYAGKIKVTGKAVGETAIRAYAMSDSKVQQTCRIRVVEPVYTTELRLDQTELVLMDGEQSKVNADALPLDITCRELEWSSSNPGVANVSGGIISAVGPGETVITAKAMDGSEKEASCKVTVYAQFEKMDAPYVVSYDSRSVRLRQYADCEYSMDRENWQDSGVFEGLNPDCEYHFYIRRKEFRYMKAGEPSEGTVVRTRPYVPVPCRHENTKMTDVVEASCTEDGFSGNIYCTDCQSIITRGRIVKSLGHAYTDEVTKEATETEEGVRTYRCQRCRGTYTEAIPRRKPETKPEPEEESSTGGNKLSGEEKEGEKSKTTESGHRETSFVTGGYKYKITGDLTVSFEGLENDRLTRIVIPKTVKMGGRVYKVTSIANGAVKNQKVTHVTIGANVEVIGKAAFAGCTRLLEVVIGAGTREIKAGAFRNCKKLKCITIKSLRLKSVGKNALKKIKAHAAIRVPKKKLRVYKALLKGKGQSPNVTIKRKKI